MHRQLVNLLHLSKAILHTVEWQLGSHNIKAKAGITKDKHPISKVGNIPISPQLDMGCSPHTSQVALINNSHSILLPNPQADNTSKSTKGSRSRRPHQQAAEHRWPPEAILPPLARGNGAPHHRPLQPPAGGVGSSLRIRPRPRPLRPPSPPPSPGRTRPTARTSLVLGALHRHNLGPQPLPFPRRLDPHWALHLPHQWATSPGFPRAPHLPPSHRCRALDILGVAP